MATYEEVESFSAARMGGVGGSDVAAIVGLNPYRRPIDVWESKVYPDQVPDLDKECLWFGNALEPVIRGRYAVRNNIEVIDPVGIIRYFPNSRIWGNQTIVTGRFPWMLGTADGWVPSVDEGLEIKNVGRKNEEWGTEGSDEIPAVYTCQTEWYIDIHNAKGWRVAPLFSGNTLGSYYVARDEQLISELRDAVRDFWESYVVKKVEPPIDESENYGRYLSRRFSLATGKMLKNPPMELNEATLQFQTAQDAVKEAEAVAQLRKNQLASLLADSDAAITPFGKVAWQRSNPRKTVDWKSISTEVGISDLLIAKHTKETPVTPFIRFWAKK